MRASLSISVLLVSAHFLLAQEAFDQQSRVQKNPPVAVSANPGSAWLDLRQATKPGSAQAAPAWVEAVDFIASPKDAADARSVFRIRVKKPGENFNVLFVRLFFYDKPGAQPEVAAWDESGSQLLRSRPLGAGIDVDSSDSVVVPMHGASALDISVPGDGSTVRGAYLDWMTSSELVHAVNEGAQAAVPQPFAASVPLRDATQDNEQFGTVTASLSADPIRIASNTEDAATFEFGIEAQPLLALLTFEIAAPRIDSLPEVTINGTNAGAVSLMLPDLADPAYRGEMRSLVNEMQFQYTGWIRAQKIVPAPSLHAGSNTITILNGANTSSSVIRATQIQLKYLWDKSDYILKPER